MEGLKGSIFITGGAGFLGRGIMRAAREDCVFTVYSRDEAKQHYASLKYDARYILGDILDFERLKLAMLGHETVIHAAAMKFIPEAEANPSECVRVNIDGTITVIHAARAAGVKRLVIISTDKAPSPVNVYGMTKAVCERLVGELFDYSGYPIVTACRYGNVIGSTGSVWHTWKKQAATDGVIKVTDPSMTRYMMSVDDAVNVINIACRQPSSGIVLLAQPKAAEMGPLAFEVGRHLSARVEVMGPRPGEKIHENMLGQHEVPRLATLLSGDGLSCLLPVGYEDKTRPADYELLLSSSRPAGWMASDEFIQIAEDSESI